jgi:hypothetical protein
MLTVRKQGYPDDSPETHPYFAHPLHQNDQYSISFAIVFKKPVNGNDLIFGNDFDRPIRDRLPPGFNAALKLVKWTTRPWTATRTRINRTCIALPWPR